MPTLENALRELRREVLASLSAAPLRPGEPLCTVERITLSLAVELQESEEPAQAGRFIVAAAPSVVHHRVSVEFVAAPGFPQPPAFLAQAAVEAPVANAVKAAVEVQDLSAFSVLSEVFGAPGFDSSARASVFRDVLEELSPELQHQVLVTLESPADSGEEATLSEARRRILRLAGSGPSGAGRGPALLRELAQRESVQTLVLLAAVHWRTPSEWAAAPYSQKAALEPRAPEGSVPA
ncbi:MAG: hypothetical protein DVB28_002121 [Verrucomicrobia bacterium]|nr:MAG: hypothetical protein DVB28_002121 [Verrucomicrobiota bacterium]